MTCRDNAPRTLRVPVLPLTCSGELQDRFRPAFDGFHQRPFHVPRVVVCHEKPGGSLDPHPAFRTPNRRGINRFHPATERASMFSDFAQRKLLHLAIGLATVGHGTEMNIGALPETLSEPFVGTLRSNPSSEPFVGLIPNRGFATKVWRQRFGDKGPASGLLGGAPGMALISAGALRTGRRSQSCNRASAESGPGRCR